MVLRAGVAAQGGVLFAQSTQVTSETQAFPPGAVIVLPPRVRIVGSVHLVNASDAALDTTITLDLVTTPAREYENDTLDPIYFGNRDGEMCLLLAFTDSTTRWAGGAFNGNAVTGTCGDGVALYSL